MVGDLSWVQVLKHLLLIEGWGELWAIPVEFQYYLAIPFVAIASLCVPRMYINVVALLVLALALLYGLYNPGSVFSNELIIVPKLAPFVCGSLFAMYYKNMTVSIVKHAHLRIACVSVIGLIVGTLFYRWLVNQYIPLLLAPYLSLAISVSVTGLIYTALKRNCISSILGARPLVFLGEISFSVYLLHMFVIRFVQQVGIRPPGLAAWLALALSVLVAALSYWVIKRPGIHAGKVIGKSIRNWAPRRFKC